MAATTQESTTAVTLLLLLLLACYCCLLAASSADADAIADLARSLARPPPSWTAGGDVCSSFKGISCSSSSGRVTAIDLAGMGLAGTLPTSLSSLTALESLQLAGNALSGMVPPGLGEIPSLRNISLSGNYLQGPVPRFAAGVATDDVFAGNGFCPGQCDAQVTILLQVAEGFGYPLSLARSWRGNDPCRWYRVFCYKSGDVAMILLYDANLSGTISPAIAHLTQLRRLELSNNSLAGEIPESLTTLPNLELLDVSNNMLTGQLPKFNASVRVLSDGNRFGDEPPPSSRSVIL